MITAQDVREKTFEKSKFNGYEMQEVDEFLEELADDLTASQKEVATLKAKMKVLAEKIEEYRSNESAINQTLLSAQKLAVQIENDAKAKAEKIVADAQAQADEIIGGIQDRADFEEKRLETAKTATAKFFDGVRAMCNAQLRNIENISADYVGKKEETAAPQGARPISVKPSVSSDSADEEELSAVEAAVRSIEASVARISPEASVQMDLSKDMDAPESFGNYDSTQPFSF